MSWSVKSFCMASCRGAGVGAVLDGTGETGWRLHVEVGDGRHVAGHTLGVRPPARCGSATLWWPVSASSGASEASKRGEVGLEQQTRAGVRPSSSTPAMAAATVGTRGMWYPEVGIRVASGDVEHRCGVHDLWRARCLHSSSAVHPGVVAGPVLNDDPGLGQVGGIGGVGLEEVGVGIGVRDERGHRRRRDRRSGSAMLPQKFSGGHHRDHGRGGWRLALRRTGRRPARPRPTGGARRAASGRLVTIS